MRKCYLKIILVLIVLMLTGCGNSYKGYWCNYDETATIVILLNKDNTAKQRENIVAKVEEFQNVVSNSFYSREDYANELGGNIEDLDIYDTYVVIFDSMDSIGTYIEELNTLSGVKSAEQSNAKSNISLYNLENFGKYTFTDSDEALDSDLETGKYRIKKGVITFTPKDSKSATRLLYIKNGLLCGDAECNEIYASSDSKCGSSN